MKCDERVSRVNLPVAMIAWTWCPFFSGLVCVILSCTFVFWKKLNRPVAICLGFNSISFFCSVCLLIATALHVHGQSPIVHETCGGAVHFDGVAVTALLICIHFSKVVGFIFFYFIFPFEYRGKYNVSWRFKPYNHSTATSSYLSSQLPFWGEDDGSLRACSVLSDLPISSDGRLPCVANIDMA